MGNLIRYNKYDPAAADEEAKQMGGNSNFAKIEVGQTRLRILPPTGDRRSPFKLVRQHTYESPKFQYPVRFECLGKGCPACAEETRLSRTGNPHDVKLSKDLRAKPRVFAAVVVRGQEEDGPKVWEFGKMVHDQLTKLLKNEDAGGDYTDPYDGFDIIVEREGTKMDTTYTVFPARQSTPLSKDEEKAAEWVDAAPDLDKASKIMSIDEVEALLLGDGGKAPSESKRLPGRTEGKAAPRGGQAQQRRRTAQDDLGDDEA